MTKAKPPRLTIVIPDTNALSSTTNWSSEVQICVQGLNVSDDQPLNKSTVNSLRQKGIQRAHSPWVWLVDRDCEWTQQDVEAALKCTYAMEESNVALAGGFYRSHPSQSRWERSYNSMCNTWSHYSGKPIAGNALVNREKLGVQMKLSEVPFGQEEHAMTQFALDRHLDVSLFPSLSLTHRNNKSLRSWVKTCFEQSQFQAPKNRMGKSLFASLSDLKNDRPSCAVLTLGYFGLSRLFNFFHRGKRASLSLKSVVDSSIPQPLRIDQNPHL